MISLIFALLLVQDKAVVEGIVLNALTNEPLRKAAVILSAKKTYTAVSSNDGKFRFEDIEPGEYQPRVQRQGFLDADSELSLEVSAGQHLKDVIIKLTPQGIIAGHVLDEDGDPVADAMVHVERSVRVGERKVSLWSDSETTDGEGYFFIGGLKAGRYHLSATPPDNHRLSDSGPREDLVHTEVPMPIELAPGGAVRDVEIRLRKSAVFRVRGRVSNKLEAISLHLASETEGYNGRVHGDGTFDFESVAPGSYTLSISNWSVFRPATLFCRMPVAVSDHDVDGIVAELTAGANIEGTIKMDGDGRFDKPPTLTLMGVFPNGFVAAKEDGTFGWTDLAPRQYFLNYQPPKGFYVKSILFNRQPLTGETLDLTSGAGGTLDIVVAPNAATISVRVEGGKRAQVALWNESTFETSDAGADGTATFDRLAPGEYRVAAWEKVESEYLRIPEFRARFEGQTVTLAEGAHANVEVKLIPKSVTDAEIAKLQ